MRRRCGGASVRVLDAEKHEAFFPALLLRGYCVCQGKKKLENLYCFGLFSRESRALLPYFHCTGTRMPQSFYHARKYDTFLLQTSVQGKLMLRSSKSIVLSHFFKGAKLPQTFSNARKYDTFLLESLQPFLFKGDAWFCFSAPQSWTLSGVNVLS